MAGHGRGVPMKSENGGKDISPYTFRGPWTTFGGQVLQAFDGFLVRDKYTSMGKRGGMATARVP